MKGLLKILIGIIGVLIVIIVAAAILIPRYFDPNDYKDEITALVKKQTGRELQIPGELDISVFPWLGVTTGKLVLSNAESFGPEPMITAEGIEVRVKLLPLLRKEIEMGTVIIDQLQANLARNEQGRTNWDDLIKAAEEAPAETKEPSEPTAEGNQAFAIAGLAIGGLDISDSKVSWVDKQNNQRYVIDNLNLTTGALVPGEPIDIDLKTDVDASDPQLKGHVDLAGTVNYDLEQQQYQVTPLSLDASLAGQQLPGGSTDINLSADTIAVDLQANTASIRALSLAALNTRVEGDITARNIDHKLPGLQGFIKVSGDNLPALLKAVGKADLAAQLADKPAEFMLSASFDSDAEAGTAQVTDLKASALGVELAGDLHARNIDRKLPGLQGFIKVSGDNLPALLKLAGKADLAAKLEGKPAEFMLNANFDSDAEAGTAQVTDLKVSALGIELAGDLQASQTNSDNPAVNGQFQVSGLGLQASTTVSAKNLLNEPSYSGHLKLAPFSPRDLMQDLAIEVPETADASVLTKLSLDTDFSGTTNSINLGKLHMVLDDSQVTGSLGVADIANQALRFDLNIDRINADRYLPPPAEGEAAAPATPETAAAGAAAKLPMDMLRALDIRGTLGIGELIISKATLSNVSLKLNAKDGVIKLAPVTANLYEGSYQGNVNLNATGEQPALAFTTALAGVNIESLLADMTGEEAKLTGMANIDADLNARGAGAAGMKKTLTGTAKLRFENGAYKGINLGHFLRQANAVLEGKSLSDVPESQQTDFSEMTATLNITNGLIKNDDLSAKSPAIRVAGAGQADLVSEKIDYTVQVSVAKTSKGQGGKGLEAVGGYTVPVHCKGTFAEPDCKPDFEGLLKAKVDKAIDKQTDKLKEKVQEKLEDKLGDGVGDKLKGLLGGGTDDKVQDKPAEGTGDKVQDKPAEEVGDKLKGLLGGGTDDKVPDKPAEGTGDKVQDKLDEGAGDKLKDMFGF